MDKKIKNQESRISSSLNEIAIIASTPWPDEGYPTREIFEGVKKSGFNTILVPVSANPKNDHLNPDKIFGFASEFGLKVISSSFHLCGYWVEDYVEGERD